MASHDAESQVLWFPDTQDPRWGVNEFDEYSKLFNFVTVGLLRDLKKSETIIPSRQELEKIFPNQIQTGPIPSRCQLYAVSHGWLSIDHPDPTRDLLGDLVAVLDKGKARSFDLVFMEWTAMYLNLNDPQNLQCGGGMRDKRTEAQRRSYSYAFSDNAINLLTCHCSVKQIVLPDTYETVLPDPLKSYFNTPWRVYEFSMYGYTQRIVNSSHSEVNKNLRLECFDGIEDELRSKMADHPSEYY